MKPLLTARQKELFLFIQNFQFANGYFPTRAEMAQHMDVTSANAMQDMVKVLERKGYIERLADKKARAFKIVEVA